MLAVSVKSRSKAVPTKATPDKDTLNPPSRSRRNDCQSERVGFWEMSATEALKVCYVDYEHQSTRG